MGSSGMGAKLSEYVKKYYPDSKSDLFAVFIERCGQMTAKNSYQAMITQHAWMFLSSFEKLREQLLLTDTVNMVHLGARAFDEIGGEVVQTTSFVLRKSHVKGCKGVYCRLIEPTTQKGKENMFLAGENRYESAQNNFSKIPGSPIAYWISKKLLNAFTFAPSLSKISEPKVGLQSGNSEKYFRLWQEVNFKAISFDGNKTYKWFPCVKGGESRKWYGNNNSIIDWSNNGAGIKSEPSAVVRNPSYYFQSGLTWTKITSVFALRFFPQNMILSDSSVYVFPNQNEYLLGLLNSKVAPLIVSILNPTLNFVASTVGSIPIIESNNESILQLVKDSILLSKTDWDAFETSWDFTKHPLLKNVYITPTKTKDQTWIYDGREVSKFAHCTVTAQTWKLTSSEICDGTRASGDNLLMNAYQSWRQECADRFDQLKANEEELNRIFIDIYGLQDELTPEVENKDVTVRKADLGRDIRSLISYAVG